jgi:hypothetical protein
MGLSPSSIVLGTSLQLGISLYRLLRPRLSYTYPGCCLLLFLSRVGGPSAYMTCIGSAIMLFLRCLVLLERCREWCRWILGSISPAVQPAGSRGTGAPNTPPVHDRRSHRMSSVPRTVPRTIPAIAPPLRQDPLSLPPLFPPPSDWRVKR